MDLKRYEDLCKIAEVTGNITIGLDELKQMYPLGEEPVRHGKWIISSDGYYAYCSECKREPTLSELTNYCPFCGSKMS